MNESAGTVSSSLEPSALGLSYVEAGYSTKKLASTIVETLLTDFFNIVLSSFAQLRTNVHDRPLYIMMEPMLGCDPAHDHEAPKDVLPLFRPYIDKAETQILNLPTSVLKLKMEEQIIQQLKGLSDENLDLHRQLDNVRSMLEDIHRQVSSKDVLMSTILKSKSDEKVRFLTELQHLREQLYQKRVHGGVNIYKPDFGYNESSGHNDNGEADARELWNARLRDKDEEILQLNKQILAQNEELATLKGFTKDSMDEAERHKLETLMKNKTAMDLAEENAALKQTLELLQKRSESDAGVAAEAIEALTNENNELKQTVEQHETNISTLRNKCEGMESKIMVLEAQLTESKQRHTQDCELLRRELEKANSAANAAKENMKKQALIADRLKTELDMLSKNGDTDSLILSLQAQIEKLQKDSSKLTSDIKIYRAKLANANAKISKLTGKPIVQKNKPGSESPSDFSVSDQKDMDVSEEGSISTSMHDSKESAESSAETGTQNCDTLEATEKKPQDKTAELIAKYREIVCYMANISAVKLPVTLGGLTKFLNGRKKKTESDLNNDTSVDSENLRRGTKAGEKGVKPVKGTKSKPDRSSKGNKEGAVAKRNIAGKNVAQTKTPVQQENQNINEDSDSYYYSYSISSNDTYLLEDKIDDDFFGVGGDPDAMVRRGDVEAYVSMKIQTAVENFRFEYDNEAELRAMGIAHATAKAMLESCSHRSCQTYVSFLTDTMCILQDADVIDENDGLYLDDGGNWRRIGDVAPKYGQGPDDMELNKRRVDLFNYTSQTDLPLDDPNHPLHRRDAQLAMTVANKVMTAQAMGFGYRLNDNPEDSNLTTNQVFSRLYNDTQRLRNEANARREKMDSTALQYLKIKDTSSPYQEVIQANHKLDIFGSLIVKASAVPETITSPAIGRTTQQDKKTPGNAPSTNTCPKTNSVQKSGERIVRTINNVAGMNVASVKVEQPADTTRPKKPMIVQQRFDPKQRRGISTKEKTGRQLDTVPDSYRSYVHDEDRLPPSGISSPGNKTALTDDAMQTLISTYTTENVSEYQPLISRGNTPRMLRLVNNTDADGIYVRMSKDGIINGQIVVFDGYLKNISYKCITEDNVDKVIYLCSESRPESRLPSSPAAQSHSSIIVSKAINSSDNAIQSPEINITGKQQIPEYDSEREMNVHPDVLIDTVIEDGNSDLLRTTGDDSTRPSTDFCRTPAGPTISSIIISEGRQKPSNFSVVGLESISEAQKLSISFSSSPDHAELSLQETKEGDQAIERLPSIRQSDESFVIGKSQQITVAEAEGLIGKSVVDLQKSAILNKDNTAVVTTLGSQSKLSDNPASDDSLLRALAILPITAAEDEFLSAPQIKNRYKSQRERDLLEPGAALQLIKVKDSLGYERLIEIITKPGDTPYFYDTATERKYSNVQSLQLSLRQEVHNNNYSELPQDAILTDNDPFNFSEPITMQSVNNIGVRESEESSKVSLQLEPNGPEITIKSLAETADEQIRQLFKLTVDKHGRPRKLTEVELDLLTLIKNRKLSNNTKIRLQRGYPASHSFVLANKVSINENPDIGALTKTNTVTTTAFANDPMASEHHQNSYLELSPDEVTALYFKTLEQKRGTQPTKPIVGAGLHSRKVTIAPQVSSISIKGHSEEPLRSSLSGRYFSVNGRLIEYVEEDQFIAELDGIAKTLMNEISQPAGSNTEDLTVLQKKLHSSNTEDSRVDAKLQSIQHIRDQLTKGSIKVIRTDDGSRMFMDSRGFVLNGNIVEDMLKEEPDKLCTQLDILTSLVNSELQSRGMLDGIKVRTDNGIIEADLLLPRMPIQTTKEAALSTRHKSDQQATQSILTTDSVFNSSYYMDLSLNSSKMQTTPPGNSLVSINISTIAEDGRTGVPVPQNQVPHRASTSGTAQGHFIARNSTRSIIRSQLGPSSSVTAGNTHESPKPILKPLRNMDSNYIETGPSMLLANRTAPLQRNSGDYKDSEGLRFVKGSVPSLFVRSSKGSLVDDSETNAYTRGGVVSHGVAEILLYSKQNSYPMQPGALARGLGMPTFSPKSGPTSEGNIICKGVSLKGQPDPFLHMPPNTSNVSNRPRGTVETINSQQEINNADNDTKLLTCSVRVDSPISPVKSCRDDPHKDAPQPCGVNLNMVAENMQNSMDEVSDIHL